MNNQLINGLTAEQRQQLMADVHERMSLEVFSDTSKTLMLTPDEFASVMCALEIAGEL